MLSRAVIRTRHLIRQSQVSNLLEEVGDVWTYLITRELLIRNRTFDGLVKTLGVPRGTLSSRLTHMEASGLIRTKQKRHSGHMMTAKGAGLFEYLLLYDCWVDRWYGLPGNRSSSGKRRSGLANGVCKGCEKPVRPALYCVHCGQSPLATQVNVGFSPDKSDEIPELARVARQTRQRFKFGGSSDHDWLAVVADRWSSYIIACQFFGIHSFNDIEQAIGIPSSTLAQRLQHLVQQAILVPNIRSTGEQRSEYILSIKGLNLYPALLAATRWVRKFSFDSSIPPLDLTHEICGQPLEVELKCQHCKIMLSRDNLRY